MDERFVYYPPEFYGREVSFYDLHYGQHCIRDRLEAEILERHQRPADLDPFDIDLSCFLQTAASDNNDMNQWKLGCVHPILSMLEWCEENCSSHVYVANNTAMGTYDQNGTPIHLRFYSIMFREQTDAMGFKLRWDHLISSNGAMTGLYDIWG